MSDLANSDEIFQRPGRLINVAKPWSSPRGLTIFDEIGQPVLSDPAVLGENPINVASRPRKVANRPINVANARCGAGARVPVNSSTVVRLPPIGPVQQVSGGVG